MIKLWYEVEYTQHSTPVTPARRVRASRVCRLGTARADAQALSIQYGNAAIFEMPAGHVTAQFRDGVEVDIHDGTTPVAAEG